MAAQRRKHPPVRTKKRRSSAKPSVRRITAPVRERLKRLTEVLAPFLPLTSASKHTVTFTTFFRESGVGHYLGDPKIKKKALEQGLTEVYRRHEKLPFGIIRKIVPAAVEYRRYKRDPLTRREVDDLAACLCDLGIDMTRELAEIEIDESLPRITVPPEKLQKALSEHNLRPALRSEPLTLFENGHFNEAVRKAAERFEDRVREMSGLEQHGRDLMSHAFADGSLLDIASYQPENQKDFQEGFKFLAMGMMAAIRNVFSHGNEKRRSPEECFETFLFLNWLFRALMFSNDDTTAEEPEKGDN